LIAPNSNFRPNPERGVYVHGVINADMVCRLTPRIVHLQSKSRDPITVYIDSRGGELPSAQSLWKLLTCPTMDYGPACRVITVVTTRAASAAADLLSSGDYAIALPHATVLYHGSRTYRELPLTVETTSALSYILRVTNDAYAMGLMAKMESRFMFRFLFSKGQFESIRKKTAANLTDSECFLAVISENLSEGARKLFETARQRQGRYDKLLSIAKKAKKYKNVAKTEASRIKAIVDYEVASNRKDKNWTFQSDGLNRLNDDFFLLSEHLASSEDDRISQLCKQWGIFAVRPEEKAEIDKAPEGLRDSLLVKKVRPTLEPMWSFFVALCHALQEGENDLTARDAFWLGLVDEVMGEEELPSMRVIAEYKEDPPEKHEKDEKGKAASSEHSDAAGPHAAAVN
jgi:ATP-dependent protease ClpP protease subunit